MGGMFFLEVAPNIDPDVVRPGLTALLVVIGLLIAVALLAWSMMRHIRRISVPYADEVDGAAAGVKAWGEEMRAKSPDQEEDDEPVESAASKPVSDA